MWLGSVLTKRVLTPQCDKGRPPLIYKKSCPAHIPSNHFFIIKRFSRDDYKDDSDDDGGGNDNDGKSRL